MMGMSGSNRVANSIVSASGAAVLAVFAAGHLRTQSAAERFASQVAHRRVAPHAPRPKLFPYRPYVSAEESTQNLTPSAEDRASDAAPASAWKDGTYKGWGFSRHGNIEAAVVVKSGRIASAVISQCRTRYSCSVIDGLPPEVAQRQGPDVDYVSGATQSADAFYEAVVAALSKAK
jgi:uncharacterized protein with FMN-binding domain